MPKFKIFLLNFTLFISYTFKGPPDRIMPDVFFLTEFKSFTFL